METGAFTVKDIAARFSIHEKTVIKEIKKGHLQALKIGSEYRIEPADLEAYIKGRKGAAMDDGANNN